MDEELFYMFKELNETMKRIATALEKATADDAEERRAQIRGFDAGGR